MIKSKSEDSFFIKKKRKLPFSYAQEVLWFFYISSQSIKLVARAPVDLNE